MTLQLVPFAEGTDPAEFAAALAPGFGGDEGPAREVLAETCALLTRDPRPAPWGSYLVHLGDRAIGIAAFKSAPTPEGEIELAYMTFPAFEGRGHAIATIAALVRIAEAAGAAPIAHTLPEENASNKALRRNGFAYAGEVDDPEEARSGAGNCPQNPSPILGIAAAGPSPGWSQELARWRGPPGAAGWEGEGS